MRKEYIQIIASSGRVVDEIPLLTPGRGRNAEKRNAAIKENDVKLRKYIREHYRVTLIEKEEGKE